MPAPDLTWIAAGRRPFHDFSVGSLVPVVFDRYARVLHPAWSPDRTPVRWATVATWAGREIHAQAQWDLLARQRGVPKNPAPFVAEPDRGGLPSGQLAALCALLAVHTSTPDRCVIGMWEGYGWLVDAEWPATLALDERTYRLRSGPIDLALAVGSRAPTGQAVAGPPTILWPTDRAWFVASDPDLESTYVGGSEALVESLLGHEGLEAWPVEADDLVAIGSDAINA